MRRYLQAGLLGLGLLSWSTSVLAAPPETGVDAETETETETEGETAPELPEGFVPAQLQNEVELSYPADLATTDAPPEGTVQINFVVGVDGIPKELELASSVDPQLDKLALEAVAGLRYIPATYKEQAVEVVLSIAIPFVPPPPPEPEPEPEVEPEPDPDDEGAEGGEDFGDEEELSDGPVRVAGVVLTAGERTPVPEARVIALPAKGLPLGKIKRRIYEDPTEPAWTAGAFSDEEGKFELRGVPDGPARLVVLAPGYERFEFVVPVQAGRIAEVKWFLKPLETNPFRTTVDVEREEMVEVTQRTISVEEIGTLPGTQGDALKAIANFPGVARPPFAGGLLVIRGSAPGDSAVYLGYHEIPTLFHFGGITSVFNSDILAQIDFIPGNFDSRYGDAIGGIVNVVPRKGRRDGYHGYVDSDIFDTGVLVEGKAGKGSFALAGRRSYIDFILPLVIPSDAGLNFTLAPRYWDYQGLFDYPVSGGNLSVRAFGSDDRTVLAFSSPNDTTADERNSVESTQWFHRADLVYTARKNSWDFLVTPSYRRTFIGVAAVGVFGLDIRALDVSVRAEAANRISKRVRLRFGTEFRVQKSEVAVDAQQFAGGDQAVVNIEGTTYVPALYTTATLAATDKLSFFPGVRVSGYAGLLDAVTVDPRLRFSWKLGDKTTLNGGVGLYSQSPEPFELSDGFGNPQLGPERALHTSLGIAHQFPFDLNLDVTGFYKNLWDQVDLSQRVVLREGTLAPEFFANTGLGRIYGAELLFRKNLTRNLFGWVSYTLSRSERRVNKDTPWALFDFDQTHILTLIASYKLPYNWQVGARFRLVSGNPITPCTDGIYNATTGAYDCRQGPTNGERLPAFHQLDLRVDKSWIYPRWKFTLYLDVQNAYNNNSNVEFQNFSYNFQEDQPITSLPIVPSVGLKAAF